LLLKKSIDVLFIKLYNLCEVLFQRIPFDLYSKLAMAHFLVSYSLIFTGQQWFSILFF